MEGRMMKNKGSKILVVDDLKSMRRTLGGILEDEGHKVVTAENGYQAIESVKGSHFDIIFMDIKMPGINGVQAFSEIRRLDPKVTVIMMTAYDEKALAEKALSQGARTCLHKPFDMEQILSLVDDPIMARAG
jgi:CheY-like chemotaxis protein